MPIKRFSLKKALTVGIGPVARGANQLSTFLLTLVALQYLNPQQFGVFTLAAIATTAIRTLLYTGGFEYLLKAKSVRLSSSETLAANLVLVVFLSSIVALCSSIAATFGVGAEIAIILIVLLPSNLIGAFSAWQESMILRSGRLTTYYLSTLAGELVSLAIAIGLFWNGWGLWALVGKVYAGNIIAALLYRLIEKPQLSERFDSGELVRLLRWSSARYGSASLSLFSTYSVDLILGLLLSPSATGIFRASSRIAFAVADIFVQPIRIFAMTAVSRRIVSGHNSTTIWASVLAFGGSIGLAAIAGLAVLSEPLVSMLLNPEWSEASSIVLILCIARSFSLLDAALTPSIVAHNHQREMFRTQIFVALFQLIAVVAVATNGLVATALAVTASSALVSCGYLRIASLRLNGATGAFKRAMVPVLVPAAATGVCAYVASRYAEMSGYGSISVIAAGALMGSLGWIISIILLRKHFEKHYANMGAHAS